MTHHCRGHRLTSSAGWTGDGVTHSGGLDGVRVSGPIWGVILVSGVVERATQFLPAAGVHPQVRGCTQRGSVLVRSVRAPSGAPPRMPPPHMILRPPGMCARIPTDHRHRQRTGDVVRLGERPHTGEAPPGQSAPRQRKSRSPLVTTLRRVLRAGCDATPGEGAAGRALARSGTGSASCCSAFHASSQFSLVAEHVPPSSRDWSSRICRMRTFTPVARQKLHSVDLPQLAGVEAFEASPSESEAPQPESAQVGLVVGDRTAQFAGAVAVQHGQDLLTPPFVCGLPGHARRPRDELPCGADPAEPEHGR